MLTNPIPGEGLLSRVKREFKFRKLARIYRSLVRRFGVEEAKRIFDVH